MIRKIVKENKFLCKLLEFQASVEIKISNNKSNAKLVEKQSKINKAESNEFMCEINKLKNKINEESNHTKIFKNELIKVIKNNEKMQQLFKIILTEMHKRIADLENLSILEKGKGDRKNFDLLCELTEMEQSLQLCYDSIFTDKSRKNKTNKHMLSILRCK